MYTIIYLLTSNYTFFDAKVDGVHKAVINKIDAQVYVQVEKLDAFISKMEGMGISYLVPSQYTGEIVFGDDFDKSKLLPEFPSDYSWDLIGNDLDDYHRNTDVTFSNDLAKHLDDEMDFDNEDDVKLVESLERWCPEFLEMNEWLHHQQAEVDTSLFNIAKATPK